uniref:Bm2672 n=1 Tax=Brugia malayi TaxID=6279 RepID=A0A1I9GC87_BRUMA|nr:Bm2672 [Brugia malayi]
MQSTLTNETIRECWCEEEDICMKDVELKLQKCLDRCWARDATKVTLRPDDLRQCFIQQKPIVDHLVTCVKSNMKCCADSKYGPQIPKQDIGKIINLTGEKLEEAESKIITNPTLQPIQKVLDAVIEIGKCVKDCAMEGDGLEECFERYTLVHRFHYLIYRAKRSVASLQMPAMRTRESNARNSPEMFQARRLEKGCRRTV